jgi:hypothetical protein
MKNTTPDINLLRAELARLHRVLDEARAEIDTPNKEPESETLPEQLEGDSVLRPLIDPYLAMSMHWKWAAWFTSFVAAVVAALWTESFGAAVAVWVLLPLVIPRAWAAFVRRRKRRQLSRRPDQSQAIKGRL